MPAARENVERFRPLPVAPELDPAQVLAALQTVESELIALGGAYDPDPAAAIGLVNGAFPGGLPPLSRLSRLFKVRAAHSGSSCLSQAGPDRGGVASRQALKNDANSVIISFLGGDFEGDGG